METTITELQAQAILERYDVGDGPTAIELAHSLLEAFADGVRAGVEAQLQVSEEDMTGTPEHLAALEAEGIDYNDGREHRAAAAKLHIDLSAGGE